jgi:hypothetical protein
MGQVRAIFVAGDSHATRERLRAATDPLAERSRRRNLDLQSQLALADSFSKRQQERSLERLRMLMGLMPTSQQLADAPNNSAVQKLLRDMRERPAEIHQAPIRKPAEEGGTRILLAGDRKMSHSPPVFGSPVNHSRVILRCSETLKWP